MMIDLHCHLLPGIDDGSKSMSVSLRLAQEAVDNGVTHALLTPHHMNGQYVNHKRDVIKRTNDFRDELKKHNIPLTVFPGQEVRINGQLLQALDQDDILFADETNRYLMLEFPSNDVPNYTSKMVFALQSRGITPVIVHPERNTAIMAHPKLLFNLLKKGCLSQVTASSYVGTFGKKVQRFSQQLISHGQCYIFASDAHDLPGRKYEMRQAFNKLREEFGNGLADRYANNARSIINGEDVPINELNLLRKKRFFGFF